MSISKNNLWKTCSIALMAVLSIGFGSSTINAASTPAKTPAFDISKLKPPPERPKATVSAEIARDAEAAKQERKTATHTAATTVVDIHPVAAPRAPTEAETILEKLLTDDDDNRIRKHLLHAGHFSSHERISRTLSAKDSFFYIVHPRKEIKDEAELKTAKGLLSGLKDGATEEEKKYHAEARSADDEQIRKFKEEFRALLGRCGPMGDPTISHGHNTGELKFECPDWIGRTSRSPGSTQTKRFIVGYTTNMGAFAAITTAYPIAAE